MRIAWYNEIDALTASAISVSSSIGGQDASNLLDQRLSSQWLTDTATSQSVVFSFSAAIDVNTIGILGHNITSACTVTVEANTANSWITPAYSSTLTVYETGPVLRFLGSTQTYRYWRITFAGQASLEIGRIWLGEYLSISPSSLLDYRVTDNRNDTVVIGRGRQLYGNEGTAWRTVELSFPKSAYTMIDSIREMYSYVGLYRSLIFCNFDDLRTYQLVEPMYCHIGRPIQFTHTDRQKYTYNLLLEEDK